MTDYLPARRENVVKTVGGVTYIDPYAWLHDDTPEAVAWGAAQNDLAENTVRSSPQFSAIKAAVEQRMTPLLGSWSAPRRLGQWRFSLGAAHGAQAILATSLDGGDERVVASTSTIARDTGDDGPWTLTWFEPSPRGRYVAFITSARGDMQGEWRVAETATGKLLPMRVPGLQYSGSRPGWLPDESGFWLATRAEDGANLLRFTPVAEGAGPRPDIRLSAELVSDKQCGLTPQVSPDGRRAVVVSEPHEHVALALADLESGSARAFLPRGWLGECDGGWLDAATYAARVDGDAPRGRVVAIPVDTSQDPFTWRALVPESEANIRFAGVIQGRVVVCDLLDVSLRLRVFEADGSGEREVPLEPHGGSMMVMLVRAFRSSDELAFPHNTFARSTAMYRYDFDTGAVEEISPPEQRLDGLTVERRFATSRDGTRVPYFVVRKADLPASGPHPTLVYAYGGFNIAWLPRFLDHRAVFVEAGGVYVHACLRGGSEYGKDWYEAGRLKNKQNVFDDLFAVTEDLIARGEATPDTLVMQGESNGGLLAGAAIVQRPDLWRVVVPMVPVFDMMEPFPLTPEMAPVRAIFYEDYGDPQNPEQAAGIYAWSPYQNVKEGVAYPAVFQIFGDKDLGCMPFHGRKFTAALQHATSSHDRPILFRLWKNVGHAVFDKETAAAQHAEWLTFVMDQLGMDIQRSNAGERR